MEQLFSFNVNQYRFLISTGLLITLILLEFFVPWRKRQIIRSKRWIQNLSLTVFNSILAKLTLGFLPLLASYYCFQNQFGILHLIQLPSSIHIVLSYILLDLLIYFQHVVSHHIPMIWKFHKVHHSDPDLDVTSGFRFHPIEIILSLVLKSLAIVLLGVHPMGVVVFEVLLNAGSLFNHSNISVHKNLDNILRRIIVTPTFHLVHHSTKPSETNSNFGFTISIWDQLFKTYKPLEDLKIGLNEYPEPNQLTIQKLLMIPFEPSKTKESKNEI